MVRQRNMNFNLHLRGEIQRLDILLDLLDGANEQYCKPMTAGDRIERELSWGNWFHAQRFKVVKNRGYCWIAYLELLEPAYP